VTVSADAERLGAEWADALAAWAIPQAILDAAPESPYGFPAELFVRRGERASAHSAATREATPTTKRALEALGEGGTVLDVGAGGGATSLPLAPRCRGLIAVDGQADMLEAMGRAAARLGLPLTPVRGRWPDVAADTPAADVVVCGHVAYNAPDLLPFMRALTDHAARRVVIELTERHPLSWMNDLWLRFHSVTRPERPRSDDARALAEALGYAVHQEARVDTEDVAGTGFARRADAIALVRRRLCLAADRDDEVAEALGSRLGRRAGLWNAGPHDQTVVTLWWDVPDRVTQELP
jgi:SAM-dependent methyltransferase